MGKGATSSSGSCVPAGHVFSKYLHSEPKAILRPAHADPISQDLRKPRNRLEPGQGYQPESSKFSLHIHPRDLESDGNPRAIARTW